MQHQHPHGLNRGASHPLNSKKPLSRSGVLLESLVRDTTASHDAHQGDEWDQATFWQRQSEVNFWGHQVAPQDASSGRGVRTRGSAPVDDVVLTMAEISQHEAAWPVRPRAFAVFSIIIILLGTVITCLRGPAVTGSRPNPVRTSQSAALGPVGALTHTSLVVTPSPTPSPTQRPLRTSLTVTPPGQRPPAAATRANTPAPTVGDAPAPRTWGSHQQPPPKFRHPSRPHQWRQGPASSSGWRAS
jgi:hypothetical protein